MDEIITKKIEIMGKMDGLMRIYMWIGKNCEYIPFSMPPGTSRINP